MILRIITFNLFVQPQIRLVRFQANRTETIRSSYESYGRHGMGNADSCICSWWKVLNVGLLPCMYCCHARVVELSIILWRLFKTKISSIKHIYLLASPLIGVLAVQSGLESLLRL